MKILPMTEEVKALSKRVIWFGELEEALRHPERFIAYAMTYGTHEDMEIIRDSYSDLDLLEAVPKAPPGILGGRSWAYWNLKLGRYPAPPMPERQL